LKKRFTIKDLGEIRHALGMNFMIDEKTGTINGDQIQ
jgi:hypothetical protein